LPRILCGEICAWHGSAAAALIWLIAGAACGQTGPGVAYDRAAAIEAICRQYAAAQKGMPVDLMFDQCMSERHCWMSAGSPGYQCELPGPMTWHGGGY
jgi:hypothetical protein